MERNPEQVAFYKSREWKRTRAAYLETVNRICERCGKPAAIVHHKRYVTPGNVHDPMVTLNFGNLEALCRECHNREHFEGRSCGPGMYFDEMGELRTV